MFLHMRSERTAQTGGGVHSAAAAGDGVAEHLAGDLHDAVGEIDGAAVLHFAQGLEHLHRGDAVDGQRPEVGEEVGLQTPLNVAGVGVDPAGLLAVEPFQGLSLEGVGRVDLLLLATGLAFGAGVDALQELAAGIVALLPGFLKADHGIDAQRDAVLAAVVAALQALGFAAAVGEMTR